MMLSVSLLNSRNRIDDVKKLNNLPIDLFHIDVMDGNFVFQTAFSFEEIEKISRESTKMLDVHLMVSNPEPYIEKLKDLNNINNITIHLEIGDNVKELLLKIKKYGIKCGLSIKPNTDIELLKPYLDIIDMILVMTVEPGLGGQPFIKASIKRVKKIKKLINKYNILIEVDGGINDKTIKKVSKADIAVVGSYITTSDDMEERINKLKKMDI